MNVTLITSLYRSERYLPKYVRAVESFLGEARSRGLSCELLILPNEPTEQERLLLSPLQSYTEVRIVEVPVREMLYATWNRGVRLARGEVIGFWQCDDVRTVGAVEEAVDLFTHGAELVYGPFLYKRYVRFGPFRLLAKRVVIRPPAFKRPRFLTGMYIGPFFMFTRQLYERVGLFDEQFKIAGDFEWAVRAARVADFSLGTEIGGIFHKDGTGLSGAGDPRQWAENNIVYKRAGFPELARPGFEDLEAVYNVSAAA